MCAIYRYVISFRERWYGFQKPQCVDPENQICCEQEIWWVFTGYIVNIVSVLLQNYSGISKNSTSLWNSSLPWVQVHNCTPFKLDNWRMRQTPWLLLDFFLSSGKVYVHCYQGISRSATVVLAFLMMKRGMNFMNAVRAVRAKREVMPNDGFLRQLAILNFELYEAHKTY